MSKEINRWKSYWQERVDAAYHNVLSGKTENETQRSAFIRLSVGDVETVAG